MTEHIIDAKNKKLGRLASELARLLQGKDSPHYNPRLIGTNKVLVKNYTKISFSGAKFTDKLYHRHTGYMGHLKTKTLEEMWEKDPKKVLREAVRRMLPKNFLNDKRLKNLVFVEGGSQDE